MATAKSSRINTTPPSVPNAQRTAPSKRSFDVDSVPSPTSLSKSKMQKAEPSASASHASSTKEEHNSTSSALSAQSLILNESNDNHSHDHDLLSDHDDDVVDHQDNITDDTVTIVYIKSTDCNIAQFASTQPIQFKKQFEQLFGIPADLQIHFKNQCLKVICSDEAQRNALLDADSFMNKNITASLPRNKTSTNLSHSSFQAQFKVVIHNVPIEIAEYDIQFEANATKAYRIHRFGQYGKEPTKSIILSYHESPPDYVKLGFLRYRTNEYIPKPTRCNRCQKLKHSTSRCSSSILKCSFCAQSHEYQSCPNRQQNLAPKCANCQGDHSAAFRGCPAYIEVQQVLKLQASQGLSYKEALLSVKSGATAAPSAVHTAPQATSSQIEINNQAQTAQNSHLQSKLQALEAKFEALQGVLDAQSHQIASLTEKVDACQPQIDLVFSKFHSTLLETVKKNDEAINSKIQEFKQEITSTLETKFAALTSAIILNSASQSTYPPHPLSSAISSQSTHLPKPPSTKPNHGKPK
jgi:hypothetical protein